jgi:hypothetical protein
MFGIEKMKSLPYYYLSSIKRRKKKQTLALKGLLL